jgi:hypothetical protein
MMSPQLEVKDALVKQMNIKPKALFANVVGGVAKSTWEKTTPVNLDRLSRLFK